ncbi:MULTISPECIES: hypothetical protein [Brevibacillus]|uniref:hypothetical protein n=1 Tax=Brevibacillus TaxID=55080 RepID=UPI0020422479|nr:MULTISPECIES: hypothetical protein [Brevibacillus]MCM3625269.1 hypothetical protein [Brevibacillus borstelensis]MDH4619949.1 hypothetical protein [Brevibacillus sp. AY1]
MNVIQLARHWKVRRPTMYAEMVQSGQLHERLSSMLQQVDELLEKTKEDLLKRHPVPDGVDVHIKMQHYLWIDRTAWELIQEMILLPCEKDVPTIGQD